MSAFTTIRASNHVKTFWRIFKRAVVLTSHVMSSKITQINTSTLLQCWAFTVLIALTIVAVKFNKIWDKQQHTKQQTKQQTNSEDYINTLSSHFINYHTCTYLLKILTYVSHFLCFWSKHKFALYLAHLLTTNSYSKVKFGLNCLYL